MFKRIRQFSMAVAVLLSTACASNGMSTAEEQAMSCLSFGYPEGSMELADCRQNLALTNASLQTTRDVSTQRTMVDFVLGITANALLGAAIY